MKTICAITLLLSSLCSFGQSSVNSLKNIVATEQTLERALASADQEPPALFMMTMDDFRTLAMRAHSRIKEDEINTILQKEIENTKLQFRLHKKVFGQIEKTISWDTLSYTSRGDKYVDIIIQFLALSTNPFTQEKKSQRKRVLCEFVILEDRLLLTGNIREVSDAGYDLHQMKVISQDRSDEFYRKYSYHYIFNSIDGNVIPFQKQGKWGLISFQNEVKVPAKYDSISKFDFDYYHVVSSDGHNLLDKNFNPLFAKPRKHVRKTMNSYLVSDDGKNYYNIKKKLPSASDTEIDKTQIETYAMIQEPVHRYSKTVNKNNDGSYTFTIHEDNRYLDVAVFSGYNDLDLYENAYLEGRDSANNTVLAECTGKILLRTADVGNFDSGYEHLYNKKTRLFGIYCASTNVLIKPKYRYIMSLGKFYAVLTKDGKLGYLDQQGNELF